MAHSESRSGSRTGSNLRTACTALLAAAAGSLLVPAVNAGTTVVSCTVTSSANSNVESVDGFAEAVVDLAAFACGDSSQVIPFDVSKKAVASAMAKAVASVLSTCEGQGNAEATVSGLARAEAKAKAVGESTVRVLASSEVCKLCQSSLESFVSVAKTVTANAVAEARVQETFQFQRGGNQVFTANDVQTVIKEEIIDLLASAVGEIRADPDDGCSANALIIGNAGGKFAMCDVDVSSDSILAEIDAIADIGGTLQLDACDGQIDAALGPILAREIAVANVQAVVSTQALCESSGGPGTMACGLTMGTVTDIAKAQAQALVNGMVSVIGPGCGCDLSASISLSEMEKIMAKASAEALINVCTNGGQQAFASIFRIEVEENMATAIASLLLTASVDAGCNISITLDACAEIGDC